MNSEDINPAPPTEPELVEAPVNLSREVRTAMKLFVDQVNAELPEVKTDWRTYAKSKLPELEAKFEELGIGRPEFGFKFDVTLNQKVHNFRPCWGKVQTFQMAKNLVTNTADPKRKESLVKALLRRGVKVPA